MNINSKTKLLCLLGHPVKHSFSPIFQNAMLDDKSQNASYMAFDVEELNLESAVLGLKALNFLGANVTIPHKENVMKYIDEITEEAARVGAVNTLLNDNGKIVGYNTDIYGFIKMLKEENVMLNKNTKTAVLGTGGASKAVAVGLALEGLEDIHIYSRSIEKGNTFIGNIDKNNQMFAKTYNDIENYNYSLLINTTPLGMHPNEGDMPIDPKILKGENIVLVDLIYNPSETKFLEEGKRLGYKTINGLDMLIYQGMKSFEIWTKEKPNKEVVVNAFKENNII